MPLRTVSNVLIGIVMIFSNGCSTSKTSSGKSLPLASQWIIESFMEAGNLKPANSKASYLTIANDLKTFSGNGGCNNISGKLSVKGRAIAFKDMMSTEMACDQLPQEQQFFNGLQAASSYEIKGGELFLIDKNNQTIMVLESFR